jgi:PleD family two-component response regulator
VRVEDLAARYRGTDFCMLLPQTNAAAARLVVDRVAGVVGSTDFLVIGCPHALRPALATAVVAFAPGETAESMLDRARTVVK